MIVAIELGMGKEAPVQWHLVVVVVSRMMVVVLQQGMAGRGGYQLVQQWIAPCGVVTVIGICRIINMIRSGIISMVVVVVVAVTVKRSRLVVMMGKVAVVLAIEVVLYCGQV